MRISIKKTNRKTMIMGGHEMIIHYTQQLTGIYRDYKNKNKLKKGNKMDKYKVLTDSLAKYPKGTTLKWVQGDLYGIGNERAGEQAIPLGLINLMLGDWFEKVEEGISVKISCLQTQTLDTKLSLLIKGRVFFTSTHIEYLESIFTKSLNGDMVEKEKPEPLKTVQDFKDELEKNGPVELPMKLRGDKSIEKQYFNLEEYGFDIKDGIITVYPFKAIETNE